jgi:hypothetical protein
MELMHSKSGLGIGIAFSILAFFIGLSGIAMFISVGEATNNMLLAFATVSFLFALLAGFFSWLAPHTRWVISIAMFAPITIFIILGYRPSTWFLPGVLWTIALTCGGAYLGSRLGLRRSAASDAEPSKSASS